MAAKEISCLGLRVAVFDKGRGVGGRLATRRIGDAVFDHGAQYFTAREPEFVAHVQEWEQAGMVVPWSTGFVLQTGEWNDDGQIRYRTTKGMTSIAKYLAQNLDVRLSHRAVSLRVEQNQWKLEMESGDIFNARVLLLTVPVPQSLQLLVAGRVVIPEPNFNRLQQIEYHPCLALMVSLPGPSAVPQPGGLWNDGNPIAWMADNTLKGISSSNAGAVTIHAGPDFSRQHWDTPESAVTAELLHAARPWLGGEPLATQLHRWRYSIPKTVLPEKYLKLVDRAPLVLAGDAFGGLRVEGAALSGLAAGRAIRELL